MGSVNFKCKSQNKALGGNATFITKGDNTEEVWYIFIESMKVVA